MKNQTNWLMVAYGVMIIALQTAYLFRILPANASPDTQNEAVEASNCVEVEKGHWDCSDPATRAKWMEYQDSVINKQEEEIKSLTDKLTGSVAGYNIRSYATNPSHEKNVRRIYESVEVTDEYIQRVAKGSPVTIEMVLTSSKKYGVDPKMMLAIMQEDSQFGTAGVGARTNNPGNIANYDNGSTFSYKSWANGVEGVARWLSKHKIK